MYNEHLIYLFIYLFTYVFTNIASQRAERAGPKTAQGREGLSPQAQRQRQVGASGLRRPTEPQGVVRPWTWWSCPAGCQTSLGRVTPLLLCIFPFGMKASVLCLCHGCQSFTLPGIGVPGIGKLCLGQWVRRDAGCTGVAWRFFSSP